jgi:hypothetical protein
VEKRAKLALAIIREDDPPAQAVFEIGANLSAEQIDGMSLNEALAAAKQLGLDLSEGDHALPQQSANG